MSGTGPAGRDAEGPNHLADLAWPEVARRAAGSLLVVPLGATEQHGPHLPGTVDTEVAVALAVGLAAARPWVTVAPALPYGSSGEHAGFPGTLSIGPEAVELVLVELARSADAFAGVLVVSGHGGNAVPLRRAVGRLRREGRRAYAWAPAGTGHDSHAGRTETSVMLALRPASVRRAALRPGDRRPLAELMPVLRRDGVRAVSPSGVLGDPTGATADEGRGLLRQWTGQLVAAVDGWWPGPAPDRSAPATPVVGRGA
ncbi:mycofactocin biosynthesis peptidyl-dipeptidase MftE [Micromonospora sp. CPCC 205711]|uniref:mycofactocin biosynthesis peptidyl-dipeptidase MftE n=1 Tax=Micromonospora sp. CPCC 205547 TaxID=3122400 RepID=UPI002FF3E6FD